MPEMIVIYDPDLEVAAIVDSDNHVGYGPANIGPNAKAELEAFLLTIPYDITEISAYVLRDWFEQYKAVSFPPGATPAKPDSVGTVESPSPAGSASGQAAAAEAVATAASPPAPAPADTDPDADTTETAPVTESGTDRAAHEVAEIAARTEYEGPCVNCNGTGSVPGAEPDTLVSCNLCHGTGHLPVVTP